MSDIFVSYAREDRHIAASLATHLEAQGWTVWWDRQILAGKEFDKVIETEIGQARCVLVIWSAHSVESRWVKTEAGEGLRRDILVPILVGDCTPPLAFRNIQSVSFPDGSFEPGPSFDDLIASIAPLVKPRAAARVAAAGAADAVHIPAPVPFAHLHETETAGIHAAPGGTTRSGVNEIPWYRGGPVIAGATLIAVVIVFLGYRLYFDRPQPPTAVSADNRPGPARREPATSAFSEPRLRLFVENFLAAQTSGNPELILPFYGDRVDYYDRGSVGHDAIRQDKRAYFKRWPIVQFVLRGEIFVRDMQTSNMKTVTFTTSYEVHSPQRNQDARGMNQTTLVVTEMDG
ncbi:MAG: toll/interleukin-1 receptor domain-containing protein, partial [Acidobacteriota bacterium]